MHKSRAKNKKEGTLVIFHILMEYKKTLKPKQTFQSNKTVQKIIQVTHANTDLDKEDLKRYKNIHNRIDQHTHFSEVVYNKKK